MNLSSEKLKLFERLYLEEAEAFRQEKELPVELQNQEFLEEYRDWRGEYKDEPLMEEASREFRRVWEQREREERTRRQQD